MCSLARLVKGHLILTESGSALAKNYNKQSDKNLVTENIPLKDNTGPR